MSKRWSKLQKRLYNLMEPSLDFQIHCVLYEMNSNDGYHMNKLPRYFITIGKEIVFDYPKDFDTKSLYGFDSYIWDGEVSRISYLIEEYIQRPKSELFKEFENDRWGLSDILRICDRRVGKRKLREFKDSVENETLLKIIDKRLKD